MSDIVFKVGDCLDVFGAEPDASFDAFVCDPPAGVSFMSRTWDTDKGGRDKWIAYWAERFAMMKRKAKPGAYALVWALPRTSGWTSTALEDGGWFVQDVITHVFGTGWPKGRSALKPASEHWILARNGGGGVLQIDVARVARGERMMPVAVDKGIANEWGGLHNRGDAVATTLGSWPPNFALSHCPECEERGTRMTKGNVSSGSPAGRTHNGTRGSMAGAVPSFGYSDDGLESVPAFDCLAACDCGLSRLAASGGESPRCACGAAMWWACPVTEMDRQSGHSRSTTGEKNSYSGDGYGGGIAPMSGVVGHADSGGASRFFPCFAYHAKAPGGERQAGCDDLYWRADKRSPFGFVRVTRQEWETIPADPLHDTARSARRDDQQPARARGNVHPTVKSLDMMRRWVALVTPPGGRVGDITAGSGGTGIATQLLNAALPIGGAPMSFLGCDVCPEAVEIAETRLAWWRSVRHDVKPVKRAVEVAGGKAQASLFGSTVLAQGELFAGPRR